MCGENQALLITCPIQSQQWSMVVAASCCGVFFSAAGTGRLVAIEGKMNAAKYRDILDENLLQSAQDLRLGRRFTFQQDNDPKHTAKITKEWLHNNSVTVLEWPSQSPDLNPIEHLWRDLKMAVHQRYHPTWQNWRGSARRNGRGSPNPGVKNLLQSFPKRLMAVLNQKGASTKYWAKGLILRTMWYFSFSFLINLQNVNNSVFFCQYGGAVCTLMRKKMNLNDFSKWLQYNKEWKI